jgi:hypothetical protein
MSQPSSPAPAIGLDIGTSRIVKALPTESGHRFEAQLNAFVLLPYSKITESTLKKEQVPHVRRNGEIVVHGSEAERFADLLGVELRKPMSGGLLNPSEPDSLEQITAMLESLLGQSATAGQKVVFSVPAAPPGREESVTYHEASIRQILEKLGYSPVPINEGLAVIYSELSEANFTGIGVSCGGGLCNVCLAYMSVPVLSFSIPKGGDYIDSCAASATGELANRVRIAKENGFYLNGRMGDKIYQALTVYYEDVIADLVRQMKEQLLASKSLPKLGRPLPLVLSGGSALPQGFRERFEQALALADFPIKISAVRLAEQPLFSTAKGALIAGLAEA